MSSRGWQVQCDQQEIRAFLELLKQQDRGAETPNVALGVLGVLCQALESAASGARELSLNPCEPFSCF